MAFCPGNIINCTDNTCVLYDKHFSCESHTLHIGDRIKNTNNNKFGYVYNVNPLGSRRSIVVIYDDDSKESIFGHSVCAIIEKQVAPRDLTRIHPNYSQ